MLQLNDGHRIPAIGLGVFLMEPDVCEKACRQAFADGYRLIDTANSYMNEKAVGRAVKKSGLKREEIYLSSKIMPIDFGYEKTQRAIEATLRRLDTPYLDLLLLHIRFGDYMGAWKACEKAVREGAVKSIGISNFNPPEIRRIAEEGEILPAVDQIECHPYFQQKKMRALLKQYGIQAESWFPLGHGDQKLQHETVLQQLGRKYRKSPVQIILRWHVQEGLIPLPKTSDPAHIKENFDIFDFCLTDEEMAEIRKLDMDRSYFQAEYDQTNEEERAAEYLQVEHPDYDGQK